MDYKTRILLEQYRSENSEESAFKERMLTLLDSQGKCFDRKCFPAHFTGSALVVSRDYTQVLLTHHYKIGKWFQFGGHADGNPDIFETALRETEEESSLLVANETLEITLGKSTSIFDIDIHTIYERGTEPDHEHFDIRFLFFADPETPLKISKESKELRWFPIEEALALVKSHSETEGLQRLLEKVSNLDDTV